jgi:hypothetical protein
MFLLLKEPGFDPVSIAKKSSANNWKIHAARICCVVLYDGTYVSYEHGKIYCKTKPVEIRELLYEAVGEDTFQLTAEDQKRIREYMPQ